MAGRQTADVVFCVDASASMQPCFGALKRQIRNFVIGLNSNVQIRWDLRLDFVAYQAGVSGNEMLYSLQSLYQPNTMTLVGALYGASSEQGDSRFFTTDVEEFARAVDAVSVGGDEATFVALDTALDFPWRDKGHCHRALVLLTDEPLETGIDFSGQTEKLPQLIDKIHKLKVKLFLVGPTSNAFDQLSAADGSEYEIVRDVENGLQTVDFAKVLEQIGKSVSVTTLQSQPTEDRITRALFNQSAWVGGRGRITGR